MAQDLGSKTKVHPLRKTRFLRLWRRNGYSAAVTKGRPRRGIISAPKSRNDTGTRLSCLLIGDLEEGYPFAIQSLSVLARGATRARARACIPLDTQSSLLARIVCLAQGLLPD